YVSFKAVYGGVRQENDPNRNSDLLPFPVNSEGIQTTYTFSKLPYAEGSIGLGNIFKFLRIDLVKRFNYLNHPDAPSYGIRAKIKIEL
ncbi:MAG: Membrane protein, partial [Pedobacter sp.]|nr:Membrane protein [Pedobacter sp.]